MKERPSSRKCPLAPFFVLALLAAPAAVLSQEAEVSLRVMPAAAEPGEEVAVEFRATLTQPVLAFTIHFELSEAVADFLRTEVEGTASAHVGPRALVYIPDTEAIGQGTGSITGVFFGVEGQPVVLEPGVDLLIVKAILRPRVTAPAEDYVLGIKGASFTAHSSPVRSLSLRVEGEGTFRVKAPTRPRPVGNLRCVQEGPEAALSWSLTENYDSLSLRRNGRVLAALPGSEGSYRDRPPLGLAAYEVVALRGGSESLPAACSLLVEVPRPPPITDFACADSGGAFALSWRNGAEYDAVALFRSGMLIAELAGTTQSYSEPFRSSLLTIYTLEGRAGGAETLPATCALNNIASASVRAEEVTAAPGEPLVPIRIYATHAFPVIAYQVSLDIDPARARLRAVTLSGTAAEAIGYDFFRYTLAEEVGELSAGIILDFTPPFDSLLPSGADHHILTVIVDALGAGSTPVRFVERPERKGTPAQKTIFTDTNAQSIRVSIRDGLLLVGESPLPPVLHAAALLGGEAGGGGAGGGAGPGEEVLLRWRNALRYDSVRIERDGALLSELAGEAESFRDASPGPGIHRYRITAVKDGVASFPAVVVALPRGIPGTFIRGDADADGRLNLTDAVAMLNYLFLDGALPPCLDAADADDSGGIDLTDPVTALNYLFLGSRPLPPPGPGARWFDPTADGLTCE